MSNDPHHWMHFYQLGHATCFPPQLGSAAESTVVSTLPQSASASASASLSSSPPATHANPSAGGSGGGSASLNPEGGVTKPARRRTRASRRTPTTVMNTDTTNFRAMVQQFTGGPPSTTFGSGPGSNMLSFGFGQGQGQGQAQAPASGLGHLQYSHQQQYQQYNNLLSLNTNTNTNNNTYHSNQGGEGDSRVHFSLEGIGRAPRGSGSVTAVEGGYHQGVPRRSSSSDDNRGNNNNNSDYIF